MTDKDRIELFKKFEITGDDLQFIVDGLGYDFTEQEISYLSNNLVYINEAVLGVLIQYEEQNYLIEIMDETIKAELPNSTGLVRRNYQDIFECYLDSLDEDETTQKLLADTKLCDQVMERYETYLENCSHADAMHHSISEVMK